MSVSQSHRFLHGEEFRNCVKRIWVIHGSHLQDSYFHNILHGTVPLKRTLELWAIEGGNNSITLTLTLHGNLDFSGNQDPAQAEKTFYSSITKREQRYGNRPGEPIPAPTREEAEADRSRHAAVSTQQAAGGSGQALLNQLYRLTQFLHSKQNTGMVVVEDFPYMLNRLKADPRNNEIVVDIVKVIQGQWHRHIEPGKLVLFLSHNRQEMEDILPPQEFRKVEWKMPGRPVEAEVSSALERFSLRTGITFFDGKAIKKILTDQEEMLELVLGRVVKLHNNGEREISPGKVLDLPPLNEAKIQAIKNELDELEGIDDLKAKVQLLEQNARETRRKLLEGAKMPPEATMHLVFEGPPGTGKTTVARIISRLFNALGLLKKEEPKEIHADEIMSSFRENSGENMRRIIDEARNGVLFIDEAHQLGDRDSMGAMEAVKALIPASLNFRRDLVIILAGYQEKMHEVFNMDPGMPSRFPESGRIQFRKFTLGELWRIFTRELQRLGLHLDSAAVSRARNVIKRRSSRPSFGNARGVNNIIMEIVERRNSNKSCCPDRVTVDDLPPLVRRLPDVVSEAMAALGQFEGLSPILDKIAAQNTSLEYDIAEEEAGTGNGEIILHPGNMRFVGPPGTGKTSVARLMSKLLYGMGCTENDSFVELSPGNLKGRYQGWTQDIVRNKIKQARDGVFFIDEAYQLANGDSYDQEALTELVQQMTSTENEGTVFIIAGYKAKIDRFLETNEGLSSRFGVEIAFPNLSVDSCVRLALKLISDQRYYCEDGVDEVLAEITTREIMTSGEAFGNARWVKHNLVPAVLSGLKARVMASGIAAGTPESRRIICVDLLPLLPKVTGSETDRHRLECSTWTTDIAYSQLSYGGVQDGTVEEQSIVKQIEDTSFQVVTTCTGAQGVGTGFFVTGDGLMATCSHVIEDAVSIEVLCGPDRAPRHARPVMVNEELDLALIAVECSLPVATLSLTGSMGLPLLAKLIVFGNAHVRQGEPGRIVQASIARNDRNNARSMESDGAIESGFSGGPAVNVQNGAVVGMVRGGYGVSATELIRAEQLVSMLQSLGYQIPTEGGTAHVTSGN